MKKNVCLTKKLMTTVLTASMLMTSVLLVPEKASAAVVDDKVIYVNDNVNYDINQYWNALDAERKTPVKAGYVFGGWFKSVNEGAEGAEVYVEGDSTTYYAPLEVAELNTDSDNDCDYTGTAYAKFVPAQVLSVKAQNQADTVATTPSTNVRILSSTDSDNYAKVGFDIWVNNKKQILKKDGTALETDIIYDGIKKGEETLYANAIFGGVSQYISVWQLQNINNANYKKIIYVRPYWITKDGTKVQGLAKYVHIEDQYLELISVPVNLMTGEAVAAGELTMEYDVAGLTVYGCEAGRLLPNMRFYHDVDNKTIRMIGHTTTVDTPVSADGIYANIRFNKPSANTNFSIKSLEFGNWEEKLVEIKEVWDIKYVEQ